MMASRIPIRPRRTVGAENENARPAQTKTKTQQTARGTIFGRPGAGPLAASKPTQVAASSSAFTFASKPQTTTSRAAEIEAVASAKRKRQALQEVTTMRNRVPRGKDSRKIHALPKKTATTAALVVAADENTRPRVFVPPPAATTTTRRLSSRPSLIPVRQREKEVDLDEDEPLSKRARTSSDGPEEETAVAAALGPDAFTDTEEEVDSDVEGETWDDLDAEDWDDPLMVSEYVADIQLYLREAELHNLPSPSYMTHQPTLTWAMRALLNDWLLQVHARFHLLPETLFLAAHLIDRFLSLRTIGPTKLQLVGTTALLLASKFEETVSPAIQNFVILCDGAVAAEDMLAAEQHMLRTLDWDLRYPSPLHFLRRISKADGYAPHARTLGKYLTEITLVEHRLLATPPSLLAAAAMWLARIALGQGDGVWGATLAHYAMYTEAEVVPEAEKMLRYILRPIQHDAFYRKWAAKGNMKASVYMHEWALARWGESTKVNLAAELPALKREIRRERKAREARAAEEDAARQAEGEAEDAETAREDEEEGL
ncbi:g2/mitotic-specific cyclin cdc13 [Mycena polygramma]|nr:g2/mitotic-specific cyclin cdc13 [Mycena polygramma]